MIKRKQHKKPIYGVGICDTLCVDENNKQLKSYHIWHGILRRCYDKSALSKRPSYLGCSVCDDWKYYSNFKKWFDEHYIEGYQIDKDILINGNREYSPIACCFVPLKINSLFGDRPKFRGEYPIGVCKYRGRYIASLSVYGKSTNIATFNNPTDAHLWLAKKREYVRRVAITSYMQDEISESVMNGLIKKAYALE